MNQPGLGQKFFGEINDESRELIIIPNFNVKVNVMWL